MTGGHSGGDFLSSTELLTERTGTGWIYLHQAYPENGFFGRLPTPRTGISGLNVDNRVMIFGKFNQSDQSKSGSLCCVRKYLEHMLQQLLKFRWTLLDRKLGGPTPGKPLS